MKEKDRENIALFRYGLLAPLINGQEKNQKEYLAKVSSKVHQVPYYGPKEYTPKTLEGWLRKYRREGFDGLKPKKRRDMGTNRRIPIDNEEAILARRKERRDLSVSMFYDLMVKEGIVIPCEISYSTLHRFLKKHDLVGKEQIKEPGRKRFSYDSVNVMWQGDVAVGPYLKVNGKKLRTHLFAFIDDCSRVVPFAKFIYGENFEALKDVFKEALLRKGIPKIIYVDNGKIYRSDQFHIACASLGINLTHTKPYDAASKGKIERFFRTVRQRFLPLVEEIQDIDKLNGSFWAWLEEDYHRKTHSALEMSPLDMFLSQKSSLRMIEDPAELDLLFLKRETRKVKHDGTISVLKKLFEVDPTLIGSKVEVRFEHDLSKVLVYHEGKMLCEAKPVDYSVNARAKRSLSFRNMGSGGGVKGV